MANKCEDCGSNIASYRAKRCRSCSTKLRTLHPDKKTYKQEWARKKKYGLEPGEFDALWVTFQGKCGICGNDLKMPADRQGQKMDVVAIDHCHITGNIRGLLCNACNKGLGMFRDDTDILKRAIKWLEK